MSEYDDCLERVKWALIKMISENAADGEYGVELVMIEKYFERIGRGSLLHFIDQQKDGSLLFSAKP